MYVCVTNYSSQTTEPISIKIIPGNRASYADFCRLLRFEIFTPTVFKTPKNHFWGPIMLIQWEIEDNLVRPIQKSRKIFPVYRSNDVVQPKDGPFYG